MAKKRVKAGTAKHEAAEKKRLFVEAYCTNGGNGKQAAIKAGYAPKSAEVTASRLLRDAKVSAAVAIRRAQTFEKAQQNTQLTADEVLEDLAQAKRFDPARMYGANGELLHIKDMPPDVRVHLEGVEFEEIAVGSGEERTVIGRVAKVKYPKKTQIREQAMKHFGLFEEHNRQLPAATVNVGVLTVQPEGLSFEAVRARALTKRVG